MLETIKLVIDNDVLDEYYDIYFQLHPRASKRYIVYPYHPSLNQWSIMRRPQANTLKEKWTLFIVWFIKRNNLENYKITSCDMEFHNYFKTKARHDPDNYTPKYILDGFVESKLILDDSGSNINALTLKCGYDKIHPRTEIIINVYSKGE